MIAERKFFCKPGNPGKREGGDRGISIFKKIAVRKPEGDSASRSRDFSRFLFQFLNLRLDRFSSFFAHSIDEEDAVQMIDFVLDAAGEEAVAFEDVRSAVRILKFDSNRIAALYISPDFGKGEAA